MVIQSVLFKKKYYPTRGAAIRWATSHGFTHMKNDPNPSSVNLWRVRQREPDLFDPLTFRTVRVNKGIFYVVGKLKARLDKLK